MVIGIISQLGNACDRRTALRLDPVVATVTLADSSLLTADFHSPNSFPARCVKIVNLVRRESSSYIPCGSSRVSALSDLQKSRGRTARGMRLLEVVRYDTQGLTEGGSAQLAVHRKHLSTTGIGVWIWWICSILHWKLVNPRTGIIFQVLWRCAPKSISPGTIKHWYASYLENLLLLELIGCRRRRGVEWYETPQVHSIHCRLLSLPSIPRLKWIPL